MLVLTIWFLHVMADAYPRAVFIVACLVLNALAQALFASANGATFVHVHFGKSAVMLCISGACAQGWPGHLSCQTQPCDHAPLVETSMCGGQVQSLVSQSQNCPQLSPCRACVQGMPCRACPAGHVRRASVFATPLQQNACRACVQGIRFCNTYLAKCLQGMCAGHPFLQHL